MEGKIDQINLREIVDLVKAEGVEITVTIEPDRTEVSVQPWRPYTPTCPYNQA